MLFQHRIGLLSHLPGQGAPAVVSRDVVAHGSSPFPSGEQPASGTAGSFRARRSSVRCEGGTDLAARGVAFVGQDVAVAVAVMNRDPLVRHCILNAALEIAVAHIEEMVAAQRAAGLHLVAYENLED